MQSKTIVNGLCVVLLATVVHAQTKVSGTCQCAKPDIQQAAVVPDRPGHSLVLIQAKCTWTTPMEVNGVKDKDGVTSSTADTNGATSYGHGYFVDNMADGDKAFVRFQGTGSSKDNTSEGKWSYVGGTGKLKGLKGSGTYKGKGAEDGSATYEVEGEYTLPK